MSVCVCVILTPGGTVKVYNIWCCEEAAQASLISQVTSVNAGGITTVVFSQHAATQTNKPHITTEYKICET